MINIINIYDNFIGPFETTKYQGRQDGMKKTIQTTEVQKNGFITKIS